jgi:hypothetical protein
LKVLADRRMKIHQLLLRRTKPHMVLWNRNGCKGRSHVWQCVTTSHSDWLWKYHNSLTWWKVDYEGSLTHGAGNNWCCVHVCFANKVFLVIDFIIQCTFEGRGLHHNRTFLNYSFLNFYNKKFGEWITLYVLVYNSDFQVNLDYWLGTRNDTLIVTFSLPPNFHKFIAETLLSPYNLVP